MLIRRVETGTPTPDMIHATNHKRRVRAIADVSWESTDGGDIDNIFVTGLNITTQQPDARRVVSDGPDTENILLDGKPLPSIPSP